MMTMPIREMKPKIESSKVDAVMRRLFGNETADSVARAALRDRNCTSLLAGMTEDDITKLKPITTALISGHTHSKLNQAPEKASVGFNTSKDLVKIVKLLSAEPLLLDKVRSEGLDSDLSPHAVRKQLEKMMVELYNKANSAFSISVGTGRYEVVFAPNDMGLQSSALETPQNCFSIGGAYRNFSEAYLQSGNIFFAVIKDKKEGSVVGRFTVGIGYGIEQDPKTEEYNLSNKTFTKPQMVMARLSDVWPFDIMDEHVADLALVAYAKHEQHNGNHVRCISEGSMIIPVPNGLHEIFDDRVSNISVRNRDGMGVIQLSDIGEIGGLLYDTDEYFKLLNEFESVTNNNPQMLATEMIENIRYGDTISALHLLNEVADPWFKNCFGETALHAFAERYNIGNNLELVTAILERIPADMVAEYLGIKNNLGHTVFHIAAINGHFELGMAILERIPADMVAEYLGTPNLSGETALHSAVKYESNELGLAILERIPEDSILKYLGIKNDRGQTVMDLSPRGSALTDAIQERLHASSTTEHLRIKDRLVSALRG